MASVREVQATQNPPSGVGAIPVVPTRPGASASSVMVPQPGSNLMTLSSMEFENATAAAAAAAAEAAVGGGTSVPWMYYGPESGRAPPPHTMAPPSSSNIEMLYSHPVGAGPPPNPLQPEFHLHRQDEMEMGVGNGEEQLFHPGFGPQHRGLHPAPTPTSQPATSTYWPGPPQVPSSENHCILIQRIPQRGRKSKGTGMSHMILFLLNFLPFFVSSVVKNALGFPSRPRRPFRK